MRVNQRTAALMVFAACLMASAVQGADEAVKKLAGTLLEQHASALVLLEAEITMQPRVLEGPLIIKTMAKPEPHYKTTRCSGVVIDDSGLVAAPLMLLDPTCMMRDGITTESPLGPVTIGITTSFTSIKLVLEDGAEQEAEIVLIDTTTGLALIKAKPIEGITAIKIPSEAGEAMPSPFDSLLFLFRTDAEFGRKTKCHTGRFVQQLPEPGAMLDYTAAPTLPGAAVFDQDERLVGVCVLPVPGEGVMPYPVVMPAARIAQLAQKVFNPKKK